MSRSGHLAVLVLASAVVVASVVLDGDQSAVSLFGRPLPPLCLFRQLTGLRCPGCGLTRSFVLMGGAHPIEALRAHLFGPLMWIGVAAQIPYRSMRLIWPAAPSGADAGNATRAAVSE